MCARARLAFLLTLVATPAAAQSTTDDGIRAMLRGDYRAAVRILRPLADDTTRPDPVAQFFLGILHDTGHPMDIGRACSLLLRAATPTDPFAHQSAAIADLIREEAGGAAPLLCVAEESWQGGAPRAFVLGPDHRVVFADTSITVTYGDQEHRTPLILGSSARFLPIQYTPLDVTRPVAARRHFFQWFTWTPDETADPSSWTLGWQLFEVAGEHLLFFTGEGNLAVVTARAWPASYDVTSLVQLRVNANGEAEFTIRGGSSPRTEVITWPRSR